MSHLDHSRVFSLPLLTSFLLFLGVGCSRGGSAGPGGPGEPLVHPPTVSVPGPGLDASIFPEKGATSFVTANEREVLSSGGESGGGTGLTATANANAELADQAAGAAGAPGGAAPPGNNEPAPMPVPDPSREIVEADLYKVEGDFAYVLNRYRGLIIIDLSDPRAPQIVGRLPFAAVPTEMYVRDGRAYIAMSDYFVYWMYDPDADPLGFHGSQILIADVSDPASPKKLGSLSLDGEITDTRMVGEVIYAVSKRRAEYWRYNTADWEDTTWVASLNVADPDNIHEVDRITFPGTSTLIHAAPHAIFVAATDPNFYLYDPAHTQETLVMYVDISDPRGDIVQRGQVYIPGSISDKFKMDYFEATFRVFSQSYTDATRAQLTVVDVSHPDQLAIAGNLVLPSSNSWGLNATRFLGDRAYAFIPRWENNTTYSDLCVISFPGLSDPALAATLRIAGSVSHVEIRGDNARVLTLGATSYPSQHKAALSLFDVSVAAQPGLLSRVELGDGYSSSGANYDYKALKIIEPMGLILLPLSFYDPVAQKAFNGTQLVDWAGDALVQRGRVQNFDTVQRAFPVKDKIMAMSSMRVQIIDAADRDAPTVIASLDLIRNVYDIFEIQGTQIQLVSDAYTGKVKFLVIPFGERDDAAPLATLELPYGSVPVCFQDGTILHMIGFENGNQQVVRSADFTDPQAPRLRGELLLTNELERIYNFGQSFYHHYWSPYAGLPLSNRILPFTVRKLLSSATGRRDFESELRLLDMSDADNPRVIDAALPMNDYPFINKVTHGDVLHSTHVEQAVTQGKVSLLYHVRSYLDRIDVSDPDHPVQLPSINIPGRLVDVSEDGTLAYTIDYQWDEYGRRRNSLNVLRLEGDQAVLMEVQPVSDQINHAVFRDRTIWVTSHKYPWWGVHSDTVESRQPYTVMNRILISDSGAMSSMTSYRIQGYFFDLLDVQGHLAYLASSYPYGFLALDVADPALPTIVNMARTIGYLSRIVLFEGYAYSPLSWYGVQRMAVAP